MLNELVRKWRRLYKIYETLYNATYIVVSVIVYLCLLKLFQMSTGIGSFGPELFSPVAYSVAIVFLAASLFHSGISFAQSLLYYASLVTIVFLVNGDVVVDQWFICMATLVVISLAGIIWVK